MRMSQLARLQSPYLLPVVGEGHSLRWLFFYQTNCQDCRILKSLTTPRTHEDYQNIDILNYDAANHNSGCTDVSFRDELPRLVSRTFHNTQLD